MDNQAAILKMVILICLLFFSGTLFFRFTEPARAPDFLNGCTGARGAALNLCGKRFSYSQAEKKDFAVVAGIGEKMTNDLVAFKQKHPHATSWVQLRQHIAGLGPRKMVQLKMHMHLP